MKPIVAIVGRPNVGKSRLFNRIIGERLSIVADTPGVTRDRLYKETEWNGVVFDLVDTAGLDESKDEITKEIRLQVDTAMDLADLVLFVVDFQTGITKEDEEVIRILRKANKNALLVINKYDNYVKDDPEIFEYFSLGLDLFPVSAEAGKGVGDLLDGIVKRLPKIEVEKDDDKTKVAIIGQPNVGKSSLINKLIGESRNVVSSTPGTTRDAIDTAFENEYGKYVFIDTAGIRKRKSINEEIEKYSIIRSFQAVDRSDVCILIIDAITGVTEQDTKILGRAQDAGKGLIIAVNKWDLIEDKDKEYNTYFEKIRSQLQYASYAPIIFISALTGLRIEKLFDLINKVKESNSLKISTSLLNNVIFDAIATNQPPSKKGRKLSIYYVSQVASRPPTMLFLVNDKKLFHYTYQRYLVNNLRRVFDLEGTPIRLIIREKDKKQRLKK